jgi:hypothetical protein
MKAFLPALVFAVSVFSVFAAETNTVPASPSIAPDSRCFELRTYYAAPGKLEALNARFRDHTCALFKKHGMENRWLLDSGGHGTRCAEQAGLYAGPQEP